MCVVKSDETVFFCSDCVKHRVKLWLLEGCALTFSVRHLNSAVVPTVWSFSATAL